MWRAGRVARTQRQGWLDGLDRRFFRERYNAQRLLRQIADDVRHASSLELAAPAIVSRVEQALHATFVALFVRDAEGRRYRAVASFPPGAAPEVLEADNRVLALARLVSTPLEIARSETEWLDRKLPAADVRSIRDAAIELIVPIGSDAADDALFVLGSKRSEEPYTEDDGELLMAIGDSIAMRLAGRAGGGSRGTTRRVSRSGSRAPSDRDSRNVRRAVAVIESGTGRCPDGRCVPGCPLPFHGSWADGISSSAAWAVAAWARCTPSLTARSIAASPSRSSAPISSGCRAPSSAFRRKPGSLPPLRTRRRDGPRLRRGWRARTRFW